jgi:prevent-host-death family protein
MQYINIHAAKTHLSALVEKAASGEPFVIAKAGKPLVTVSSFTGKAHGNRVGFLKDSISVPSDFDRIGSDEIATLFEGKV